MAMGVFGGIFTSNILGKLWTERYKVTSQCNPNNV